MASSINWTDGPSGGTPLSAANLNKLAVVADVGTSGTPTGDALRAAYVSVLVYANGAYPARPAGATSVKYIGPVQPTGWQSNDEWVDNS